MDLEEWEFLPNDGFIDFDEDCEKKNYVGKRKSVPKSVFNMNYFSLNPRKAIEPSSSPPRNSRVVPNQLVPIRIQLEPTICRNKTPEFDDNNLQQVKEITKVPIGITILPSATIEKIKDPNNLGSIEADQDAVSKVYFKKMKENEFVDMKIDSPRSSSRGILPPQTDAGGFNFDDKSDQSMENQINSPRKKGNMNMDCGDIKKEEIVTWEDSINSGGLNIWKWSLNGIGAICSFGVAAATICIIILGSNQRNHQQQQQQSQKLKFQIYTDDKRIKQVAQHATKLNEAISAVRGAPITRAPISFGDYYNSV